MKLDKLVYVLSKNKDLIILGVVNTVGFIAAFFFLSASNLELLLSRYGKIAFLVSGVFESLVGAQSYLPGSFVLVLGPGLYPSMNDALLNVWFFSGIGVCFGLALSYYVGRSTNYFAMKFVDKVEVIENRSKRKFDLKLLLAFMPNTAAMLACWLGIKKAKANQFILVVLISLGFNFIWTIVFYYSGEFFEGLVIGGGPVLIVAVWGLIILKLFRDYF